MGGAFQRRGSPTFTGGPASARKATTKLTDSGDDEVGQSLVGKGGDKLVQLRLRQARGQRVEAVRFRPVGSRRARRCLDLLAGLILPDSTRFRLGGWRGRCIECRHGSRGGGRNTEEICLSRVGCWLLCHVLIPPDQPTLTRHGSGVAAFGLKREGWARRRDAAGRCEHSSGFCRRHQMETGRALQMQCAGMTDSVRSITLLDSLRITLSMDVCNQP